MLKKEGDIPTSFAKKYFSIIIIIIIINNKCWMTLNKYWFKALLYKTVIMFFLLFLVHISLIM